MNELLSIFLLLYPKINLFNIRYSVHITVREEEICFRLRAMRLERKATISSYFKKYIYRKETGFKLTKLTDYRSLFFGIYIILL